MAEPGAGVDVDDDAVVFEGDLRRLSVDVAGGVRVAAHVVAAFGAVEQLRAQRAFERLGRDLYFDGDGGPGSGHR